MLSQTSNIKRALRAELRERRRNRTSTERDRATEAFTANLIALTQRSGASVVACYLSAPSEPNTRPYLNWAFENGVRTLFPITREDGLLDWAHGDGESEVQGLFGMPEPVGELLGPIAINDVDLIVVPAAAVDGAGMRLGWGRGYFDKTLGSMLKCPPVYALIYDDELLDDVPREVHDQPVDGVVTPTRILTF
ncbi:5-formyltetrahydrofolate cyclo-ligase [Subtercola boreus]|uniref:5-formyltetrahydrofolate cyclo-ligase n=1 Tax=Subtercola boreus TaxID=120213 RepID=A0A3E0W828_9MICO|nr:5-formyltetrahydrofolate cyclo-ligase [Subtercola boreus]RFA19286.1 5-formyltetrahydrofolate cyclo-ligase [Subtercola boreus]RFA19546.1 5-formyltetrahydrofolate cyclo-ligase [Subtercola boreus]RFA25912.1 5-formyltetrahydrofolate cyclo-ligase [Subtercola boreus]